MARTRRDDNNLCSGGSSFCDSFIDLFVWDGDQLLEEGRWTLSWTGLGGVRYTHGLALDRPLSVLFGSRDVLYPHVNWRGEYFMATDSVGGAYCATFPCKIDWPGYNRTAFYQRSDFVRTGPAYLWRGSLITGQADASDLLYRRNRYYDPDNGAFIQPDPIGLAGGYNLYGYANGDPVNLGDPFGLSPDDFLYDTFGNLMARFENDRPDRYFLIVGETSFQLDYALQPGATPYEIHGGMGDLDALAVSLANDAPDVSLADFRDESGEGGKLDFKQGLSERALWNAGDGLFVHRDKVGNAAWGYYTNHRTPIPLAVALFGARMQARGTPSGQEDPLDQQFIRRGYAIGR